MENNLIICRTPFQVITALVLFYSRLKGERNDLLITSNFSQSKDVAQKCQMLSCFENVLYFNSEGFNHVKGVINPNVFLAQLKPTLKKYDTIYTNSLYGDLEDALMYFNKDANVVLFDEGYSSYLDLSLKNNLSLRHKICVYISHLLYHRTPSHKAIKQQLLYDPDLIVSDMPYPIGKIYEMETEITDKVMSATSFIFNIKNSIAEYSKKYIYFEESFANDFNNNGDLDIIEMIASIVGKENLLVKLHPRDKTNRFSNKGISTNINLSVPTEALLSEMQKQDKIFISFSSGATVNYKFICNYNVKTILLYKLVPNGFITMSQKQKEWFEKFITKYNQNIYAPETKEDLVSLLNSI